MPPQDSTHDCNAMGISQYIKEIGRGDRKSTRLNSSHQIISYAVFCLKKKNNHHSDWRQSLPYLGYLSHTPTEHTECVIFQTIGLDLEIVSAPQYSHLGHFWHQRIEFA